MGLRLLHVRSDTIPGTDDQGWTCLVHGWRRAMLLATLEYWTLGPHFLSQTLPHVVWWSDHCLNI